MALTKVPPHRVHIFALDGIDSVRLCDSAMIAPKDDVELILVVIAALDDADRRAVGGGDGDEGARRVEGDPRDDFCGAGPGVGEDGAHNADDGGPDVGG